MPQRNRRMPVRRGKDLPCMLIRSQNRTVIPESTVAAKFYKIIKNPPDIIAASRTVFLPGQQNPFPGISRFPLFLSFCFFFPASLLFSAPDYQILIIFLCFMCQQKPGNRLFHSAPLQNSIQKAFLCQKFRPLKAIGQLLSDGLGDHPRTGKTDQRSRLSLIHIFAVKVAESHIVTTF